MILLGTLETRRWPRRQGRQGVSPSGIPGVPPDDPGGALTYGGISVASDTFAYVLLR